ncbi:MAG: hypothetical protein HFJ58_00990 [Clostridia bacterium]|nr:hypothetical protein [Clostridia bacterium]
MQTRQDRKREAITNFVDGNSLSSNNIFLDLFPNELDRFKKEFPDLIFTVKNTHLRYSCKEYKVQISKKETE